MASKLTDHRRRKSAPSMHVGVMTANSEAAIWTRLIQPEGDVLTRDAAQSILRLTFGEADRKRVHELLLKNQEDSLTTEEKTELESFRSVSYLLDLMHSMARRSLKNHSS